MRQFPAAPIEILASVWRHHELIKASVKREVVGRYRGSVVGLLWSFLNPLFMLAVYTFVFSVVFKARWGTGSDSKTEFALLLFAGLVIFNLFAECVNRAPMLIVANINYVKKVVFPLEILPIISLLAGLFHVLVSLAIWLLAYTLFYGIPHYTVIYLPLIILPYMLFILGLSWALASLGVFLRDVSQIIGMFTTVLMFLSPIFYPASALPQTYRHLLYMNPLTPVVEMTRSALFWGQAPELTTLGIYGLSTAIVAWLGFAWFQKTRKGFADVL